MSDEMNRIIRGERGNVKPEPVPIGPGSADGGGGMGSQPKEPANVRMNKAIIKAWKRRRGGL